MGLLHVFFSDFFCFVDWKIHANWLPKSIVLSWNNLSNYSKIERGEIDLTISRIYEIANVLEVDVSQILNFDATQIFNISNNKLVQGIGAKAENMHFHGDDYKEKYIKLLELEVQRLQKVAEKVMAWLF